MEQMPSLISFVATLGFGIGIGWFFKGRRLQPIKNVAQKSNFYPEIGEMSDTGELKLVLVVRSDLAMGKGKVAAQCCHAAVMANDQLRLKFPDDYTRYKLLGQPKIVLKVNDEAAMLDLAQEAEKLGLLVSIVRDAGRTQIAPGSKTVLGIGPASATLVNQVTGHLKLY